ncbi:hypothetical protein [Streptomyces sp. NPDC056399]|uniref:hypothetical protein n=1 Tax=Streptomyces sp. NPDC056399 TaxID=3345807 RepID=UPI0035E1AFCE
MNTLAEETSCAIVGLAHTRKAGAAGVMEAVIGSSEQTNVARSVHGLILDPEEDGARILSCEKLNVGRKEILASLRFRIVSVGVDCADGDTTSQPRIEWLEETSESASDIMTDVQLGHDGVGDCARWLLKHLGSLGEEDFSADVKEAAAKANRKFAGSLLNRARRAAKIQSRRTSETPSRTVWRLPENTESSFRRPTPP